MNAVVYTLGALATLFYFLAGLFHRLHHIKRFWICLVLALLISLSAILVFWLANGSRETEVKALPDTGVYIVGQEFSYPPEEISDGVLAAELVPIHVPAKSTQGSAELTIAAFLWDYPENTKFYNVDIENRGSVIDRNIQVSIDFTPDFIFELRILQEERITLISGGIGSTKVVFEIEKVLAYTNQPAIQLAVYGKKVPEVRAWSENSKEIQRVYIYDAIVKLKLGWGEYIDRDNSFAINYPGNWKLVSRELWGDALVFISTPEECSGYNARFQVWNKQLPESMSAKEAMEKSRSSLPLEVQGYTRISEEQLKIGNLSVVKDINTRMVGNTTYQAMLIYGVENKVEWFLSFTTVPSCWLQYRDSFNDIANSFRTRLLSYWIQRYER